jgi:hypothetical protein
LLYLRKGGDMWLKFMLIRRDDPKCILAFKYNREFLKYAIGGNKKYFDVIKKVLADPDIDLYPIDFIHSQKNKVRFWGPCSPLKYDLLIKRLREEFELKRTCCLENIMR